ncbi:Multidrug resistance protein MdtA precursor [Stratiformator vulcanicus]|uniref:Multidrug resistance protein MdtA n=2 Tax=Stratiformator vulcanicus TaxID=2527980 RepID=A0A517QX66_9PLAN|nr:Multidrug resistance protein MdtA precursor [Stratiformator vulcanicus]
MRPHIVCSAVLATYFVGAIASAEGGSLVIDRCRIEPWRTTTLSSAVNGVLQTIDVEEGDTVQAGSVLARLDAKAVRASLTYLAKQAENDIDLRFARKAAELAEAEYLAARELNKEFAGARPEFDLKKLRLAAERSILQIEQAEHARHLAQLRVRELELTLADYSIVAPRRGLVTKVENRAGEFARSGNAIIEIAELDRVEVTGDVPAAVRYRLAVGTPVRFTVTGDVGDGPLRNRVFAGTLSLIGSRVEPVSQTVTIRAVVDNADGLLLPGLDGRMIVDEQPFANRRAARRR